jgi:hypothetical protein
MRPERRSGCGRPNSPLFESRRGKPFRLSVFYLSCCPRSGTLETRPSQMNLDYSFHLIPSLWHDGALPHPGMNIEKVKVDLQGTTNGPFPPIFSLGDLLCQQRSKPKQQHAITLLLTFIAGQNPPSTQPPAHGVWTPVPGESIYGQIRVALPEQAILAIQKADHPESPFKLILSNVSFNNVTPKKQA